MLLCEATALERGESCQNNKVYRLRLNMLQQLTKWKYKQFTKPAKIVLTTLQIKREWVLSKAQRVGRRSLTSLSLPNLRESTSNRLRRSHNAGVGWRTCWGWGSGYTWRLFISRIIKSWCFLVRLTKYVELVHFHMISYGCWLPPLKSLHNDSSVKSVHKILRLPVFIRYSGNTHVYQMRLPLMLVKRVRLSRFLDEVEVTLCTSRKKTTWKWYHDGRDTGPPTRRSRQLGKRRNTRVGAVLVRVSYMCRTPKQRRNKSE